VIVSLLVAVDEASGIGKDGRLPWRQSDDLRRFKALSLGHHILMGRKTWESINRLLPGRTTIVITRQSGYLVHGALVASSLEAALEMAAAGGESEAFVIGGGQIFALALPLAQRIYLTVIHATLDCDTFFPPLDLSEWTQSERSDHPADERNQFPYTFITLDRK
jgi:dihydrofolate reductase